MRKFLKPLLFLGLILALFAFQTKNPIAIVTEDIDHFWTAFDSLTYAKSTQDSVTIIDSIYFGQATEGLKAYCLDLGYFVGFRIAEAFYNKRSDKREAIDILLKSRDYEAILTQSGYDGHCKK